MTFRKLSKVLGVAALAAAVSVGTIGASAQDTTNVSLTVTGGALTIYAGDSSDNNDICTPSAISGAATVDTSIAGGSAASVVCSAAENSITLTGLSVASSRQNATATIDDIVFEDLRGLSSASYTITATVSNFTDGAKNITLGTNVDAATADTDPDAPTGADAGKLFAALNASGGTVTPIRSAATIAAYATESANYQKGALTTVVATTSPITLLSTTSAVKPGRIDLDGTTFKLRVPAYVEAGNYTGTIIQTII